MSIVATDLVKSFGGRRVVDGVSLRVERGEVVGLLGPNGAGKTTTFYMIVGLERCDAGRIELDGRDISRLPMYKRARLGIGYLAQEASVFRKLTVEQNLAAILEATGVPAGRRRERVEELLQEFRIEGVRKSYGYQLSGGERRRTEIARALAADPAFLLLDEPFAGVDPIAVADLQEIIAHLKAKGLGLLITDHNVRETLEITDRAYIMHEGRILVDGDSKEIAENPVARKFYLGERFRL
ncbi:MAG: LPS export ABC transporter ATP-binding protein [Limnochordales bacterium]|jgi:ABC-type (unclassified) transport system, ATPase component|nr:MAG: LPS export ABC transporter ATP-binding protein [Bacillota bacterium]